MKLKQPHTSHSIKLEVDISQYQWKTQKLRIWTEDFSIAEQKYYIQMTPLRPIYCNFMFFLLHQKVEEKKIPEITLYIQVQPPREQNKNINKQCLSLETHEYKKPESLFLNDLMKYFYSRGGRKIMLRLLLQFRNWVKNKDFF